MSGVLCAAGRYHPYLVNEKNKAVVGGGTWVEGPPPPHFFPNIKTLGAEAGQMKIKVENGVPITAPILPLFHKIIQIKVVVTLSTLRLQSDIATSIREFNYEKSY